MPPVVEESSGLTPVASTALVLGGSLIAIISLMILVACCCGTAGAAVATIDCDNPPDRNRYPVAYARWLRECEERQRNGTLELVPRVSESETASLVGWM